MLNCPYHGSKRRAVFLPSGVPRLKVRLIPAESPECSAPAVSQARGFGPQRTMLTTRDAKAT